ncbi:hypothetical protein HanRHA438_Chr02g0063751 [Helianthus annuus]|nr:hypothetical protein HanRHA438_Chr02g0063751 [Helianthus annuus]
MFFHVGFNNRCNMLSLLLLLQFYPSKIQIYGNMFYISFMVTKEYVKDQCRMYRVTNDIIHKPTYFARSFNKWRITENPFQ